MSEKLFKMGRRILEIIFFAKPLERWLIRYKGQPWTKWLPNAITFARIPETIAVFIFYTAGVYFKSPTLGWIGIIWYSMVVISDFLDGLLARLWEVISEQGMIWDPITDKLLSYLSIPGVTYLTFQNYRNPLSYIAVLLAIVLLTVEIDLALLNKKNLRVNGGTNRMKGASNSGKIKFTIECFMVFVLGIVNIYGYNLLINSYVVNVFFLIMLSLSIFFAFSSRANYIRRIQLAPAD